MTLKKFAKLICIILGPHIWLPVLITVILLNTGLSQDQLFLLFPILFILEVCFPLLYIYYAVKNKTISAWDMPKREERYHLSVVMLFVTIIVLLLVYFFGNKLLFSLSLTIFFLALCLSAITIFWKISLHSSLNTLAFVLINYLFNWQYLWLFLTIPIIFWSRLYLKRHTITQLVAGMFVTFIVFLITRSTLGF